MRLLFSSLLAALWLFLPAAEGWAAQAWRGTQVRGASFTALPRLPSSVLGPPALSAGPYSLSAPSLQGAFVPAAGAPKPVGAAYGEPEALEASGLSVAQAGDAERVAEIVQAARQSRTGRRTLALVKKLAAQRGRSVSIEIARLKDNYGEYDYARELILLGGRYRSENTAQAAATLIHELTHVLQHEQQIPAEALEMELEAHIVSLKVTRELGAAPDGTFAEAAERALRQGAAQYLAWMQGQLGGKPALLGSSFQELREGFEEEVEAKELRLAALEKKLAAKPGDKALRARLVREKEGLSWIQRDLEGVQSPEGRRRYRKFATRVMRLIRRYSSSL